MKTFIDETEEAQFNAEVAKLRELVKDPYAALHDMATSFLCLHQQLSAIRTRIEQDEEDDKCLLVHDIDEALKEAQDHMCGTDIGIAYEFGAWFTKDGWESGDTMPYLQEDQS